MILDRVDQRLRLHPGVVVLLLSLLDEGSLRHVAGRQIAARNALARLGEELADDAARAPGAPRGPLGVAVEHLGDGEADTRRNLLRLAEIGVRRRLERLVLKRHVALVALLPLTLLDRHGERAGAEEHARVPGAALRCRLDRIGVKSGGRTDLAGRPDVDHDERNRPVRLRLQDEAADILERRRQQRGEHGRLADEPLHGSGKVVALQDGVDRGTERHHTAAHVERVHLERQRPIVAAQRFNRKKAGLAHTHAPAPRHQARMPFWACRRFSASSNTTDWGPSITSAVTSSPRWAGRQCMNMVSGLAFSKSRALT